MGNTNKRIVNLEKQMYNTQVMFNRKFSSIYRIPLLDKEHNINLHEDILGITHRLKSEDNEMI